MKNNLHIKSSFVGSIVSLSSKIHLLLSVFFLLFFGTSHLNAQEQTSKNPLAGFDEKAVLKQFRENEGSELKEPKIYARFLAYKKAEFMGKKNGTWQKSLPPPPPVNLTSACGNIDFESGTFSGWTAKTGMNPGCCTTNGFVSNGINAATTDANARHTITTGGGLDPCGLFPIVAPAIPGYGAGLFSCRLGNANIGAEAEQIQTVFIPTAANNVFTYQYAVVLENPGHVPSNQPFFQAEVLDSVGNPVTCTYIKYVSGGGIPGFVNSGCGGVIYKPWSNVSVDLFAYIGSPCTVRFTTGDCTQTGHYGYCYLNCECSTLLVTQQDSCISPNTTLSAPYEDNNTYTWTGPGGPYNGQIITISQAGTYTVTMVSSTGCIKTVTKVVPAYPFAIDSAGVPQTICGDSTVNLTGTFGGAATMATWSGGAGVYTPNNTTMNCTYKPTPSEIAAGSVTIFLTTDDPPGPCDPVKDSVLITISPPATVTAGPDQTICHGSSATLAGAIGGSATNATWSGGTGTYNPNNTSPTAIYTPSAAEITAGTATLYITTNDPSGVCGSKKDTMVITINATLTANAGFTNNNACTGGVIILGGTPTGSGGTAPYTYSWSPAVGLNNPNAANPVATITANITYVVTVTDVTGCFNKDTVNLTFNPTGPYAQAGFGTNLICTGGTVLLGGNPTATGGTGPYTYSWIPTTGLNSSTIANPTAVVTSSITYYVTVTDTNGCTGADSVHINYNPIGPHADAGFGTSSTCASGTILLGGAPTVTGGTGPYTYSWTPSTGLSSSTIANPTAIITGNITYVVVVTDATGCIDVDSLSITYNPNGPHAEAGFGNGSICSGGTVLLGGNPTAANGTAPYTYSWIPATGLSNPTGANPVATINANITYVVIVTDASGCHDLDSVSITYNPNGPHADAGFGNNTICTGGTILLGGAPTGSGGTPPYTYSWAPTTGLNNPTSAYPTAVVTANTSYTVTVTDATGCQGADMVNIIYHANGPHAEAGFGHNSLCTGGNILLGGTPTASGGTAPYMYSWLPANGLNLINIPNPVATITSNTTYVIIITDADGCKDIDSVDVSFSTGPFADAGTGNSSFCFGQNMLLGGNPTGSGGTLPYTYSWTPAAGLNNPTLANPAAMNITTNTVYYLTITDATGCTNFDSAVVNIIGTGIYANDTAYPTSGFEPLSVQFTNTSQPTGLSYLWMFGDNDTSTATNPSHIFHNSGSDTIIFNVLLIATDANGCRDTSIVKIHVFPSSAATFPNIFTPNGDGINDIFNFNLHNLTILSASIYNRWGEKMYEWGAPLAGWDGRTASGSPASNGIYYYIFNAKGVEGKSYVETGYLLLTR